MKLTATQKYRALDVHSATCTYTARASGGKILERGVVETIAHDLVVQVQRFGRNVHVTFEEGGESPGAKVHRAVVQSRSASNRADDAL